MRVINGNGFIDTGHGKGYLITEFKELNLSDFTIKAWRESYDIIENEKNKLVSDIECQIFNPDGSFRLNMNRQTNDGSKLTSVNQAINQAKVVVGYLSLKQELTIKND